MSVIKIKTLLLGLVSTLSLMFAAAANAEYELNMTKGATHVSQEVYDLHMLILWICVVIGVLVFGVMFWSILNHRKSKGAEAHQFHHNTTAEVVWTIIPIVILVSMAVPATKTLQNMEDTSKADMTIKVTGYQWRWRYDYMDEGFGYFSTLASDSNETRQLKSGMDPKEADNYLLNVDNPIVVPVGYKVRFLTTAADVIHSWWVPALGWKRDAIPGFINESWAVIEKPGIYRGQCAELCGKDHAFMPIVLKAVSEDEYYDWVGDQLAMQDAAAAGAEREWSMDELMEQGEQVYGQICVACHQANGQGVPGAFPALAGGAITTGPVEDHINIVLNGKAGTAMAAFGPQLNDVDLAAVITYERNAWGNDTGDTVQPADIKAAR
jgi:cytochrome c oxidase subunit 2